MSKKTEIIPAILPMTFAELEEKIALVQASVRTVQIDVCDGQLTPQANWPYKKHDDSFEKIIHEEDGLPGWQDLNFEIDLMVNRPEEVIDEWVTAGATRIVLHAEAKGGIEKALQALSGRVEVGVAFNIDTSIEILNSIRDQIQFVQLMGIDRIGFQHQEFDERVLEKIKAVRAMLPDMPISVDGGVSLETAPQLIAAGADRLVIGSAIFDADNYIEAIREFKSI